MGMILSQLISDLKHREETLGALAEKTYTNICAVGAPTANATYADISISLPLIIDDDNAMYNKIYSEAYSRGWKDCREAMKKENKE